MGRSAQNLEQRGIEPRQSLAHQRFSSYLRGCRQQRRLSLRQVEKLSEAFPERVSNSYLAYCETGRLLPSLGKLITLSRVLGIPLQSFTERLEMDREAVVLPDAGTGTWEELRAAGIREAEAGRLQNAYTCFEKARDLAGETGPQADLMMDMAIVLKRMSRHYTARDLLEEVVSQRGLDAARMDRALIQLGSVLREMGKLPIAAMVAREAMERAARIGDRSKEAHAAGLLANALFDMGNLEEALPLYQKAARLFREIQDEASLVCTLGNLANCYVRDRHHPRFSEGIRLLREAEEMARRAGFDRQLADILSYTGLAYVAQGNHTRAQKYLFQSNQIARAGQYHDILLSNTWHLREQALRRGRHQEATECLRSLRYLRSRVDNTNAEIQAFDRLARMAEAADSEEEAKA